MRNRKRRKKQQVTLSRRTLGVLVVLVLLMLVGSVILGWNWNRWFGADRQGVRAFTPELDPNASEWVGERLPNRSAQESVGIKIPGYPSISLPAEQKEVVMALLNPEGNPCYFTFELVLRDTDEVLFTSGLVPPGQAIYDVTLSRALPAGEYDATIRISTTSLEDGSAMNGANMETVLIVQ